MNDRTLPDDTPHRFADAQREVARLALEWERSGQRCEDAPMLWAPLVEAIANLDRWEKEMEARRARRAA